MQKRRREAHQCRQADKCSAACGSCPYAGAVTARVLSLTACGGISSAGAGMTGSWLPGCASGAACAAPGIAAGSARSASISSRGWKGIWSCPGRTSGPGSAPCHDCDRGGAGAGAVSPRKMIAETPPACPISAAYCWPGVGFHASFNPSSERSIARKRMTFLEPSSTGMTTPSSQPLAPMLFWPFFFISSKNKAQTRCCISVSFRFIRLAKLPATRMNKSRLLSSMAYLAHTK